jgi:hypothetical protein
MVRTEGILQGRALHGQAACRNMWRFEVEHCRTRIW